ncbi:adenylate/guanylate cyclase domain-containing protein [Flexibacterium corallicola]|uniref:adenylate/guanylate cyclase domain-containing protein n=1 Tax=Flexibacterium corallicola TaxID=3037259 RepID=UPI00286F81E8|nr:adenylate/guanylate cyclase domain-containing protein [Pseudovibrio sp. M1P-2-3]
MQPRNTPRPLVYFSYLARSAKSLWQFVLGDNNLERQLPERVWKDLRRREDSAERLVGVVQLSFILLLSVLYFISPSAEGSVGSSFVPGVLAFYLVFTLVRLYISFRCSLPGWYLALSVLVDMGLLFGLIFSFHIQYSQHPAFYLKTPTLMYVFVFIALRALRFDVKFLLLSGAAAVIGWIALVLYAVFTDMGQDRITRNYIEYLTSNSVLIGAELDKIIIILTVTLLLALAQLRGRRLLLSAVKEQAAARELSRFFSPSVASSIIKAEEKLSAGMGEVREVAILFVDIRRFTRTSQRMSPEQTMQVLGVYQKLVVEAIVQNGGRIDKFLGDGVLAVFKKSRETPDYAARALYAALSLVRELESNVERLKECGWPEDFTVGCGIATGQVTLGVVGNENRLEYTVIGDAVNRAAKMETANKAHTTKVLSDKTTLKLATAQGFQEPVLFCKKETVAGIAGKVELVCLA